MYYFISLTLLLIICKKFLGQLFVIDLFFAELYNAIISKYYFTFYGLQEPKYLIHITNKPFYDLHLQIAMNGGYRENNNNW